MLSQWPQSDDDGDGFVPPSRRAEPEMDMTPMVDVTFLLLIFFMVTAAFAMQKSFRFPSPQNDQPSTEAASLDDFTSNPDYVVVRIDEFNTFHVTTASWQSDVEAPSFQDLLIQLRRARAESAGTQVPTRMLLVCHGDAWHEKVVQAIDAGNEVGLEDVKLLSTDVAGA